MRCLECRARVCCGCAAGGLGEPLLDQHTGAVLSTPRTELLGAPTSARQGERTGPAGEQGFI